MEPISSKRDVRLDAIRGLLLVVMAIDHLPSPIAQYTRESLGFVSAAEGFFFLSGYVAGITYSRTLDQSGESAAWRRALRRAREIYLYHLATFAVLLVFCVAFDRGPAQLDSARPLNGENWMTAACLGAVLLYRPNFLFILPMYFLFLLVTPLVIISLRNGKRWMIWVAASAAWGLAQFGVQGLLLKLAPDNLPVNLGPFHLLAWQLLYVGGLSLGFYRYTAGGISVHRGFLAVAVMYMIAVTFFMLRQNLMPGTVKIDLEHLVAKSTLGPLRLLNFVALGTLISLKTFWPENGLGVRWLAFLGRNSLQVFSVHVLAVNLVGILCPDLQTSSNYFLVALVAIITLASLYLVAWINELQKRKWQRSQCTLPQRYRSSQS